jgi:hypothetical protein
MNCTKRAQDRLQRPFVNKVINFKFLEMEISLNEWLLASQG